HRNTPRVFSLGDGNKVHVKVENLSPRRLNLSILDELPVQFQIRDFEHKLSLEPGGVGKITYELKPRERGEYLFGDTHIFVQTHIGLVERRITKKQAEKVAVFPSVIQMKHYELTTFNQLAGQEGIRKIRRIGHSYEFEQIKNYVKGDDYRSINWRATGRRNQLMVNQYEDERAQQVYCVIDKSRNMHMPFHGMTLMDYAINSTLALSNIILRKNDKAGLITFSDKIGSTIKADRKAGQLNKLLKALYNEKARSVEANFELLYHVGRKLVQGRSLFLVFTNFESGYALDRVLPVLRRMNRLHLLVIVFFENTEVAQFAQKEAKTVEDIYTQTIAQSFVAEKVTMAQKLNQYGIQTILTRPESLSINAINKYLELKARGLI
ncbi:MAG: DUF58 domain-containing protein, partial [Bacteroidetes bacterium]